MRYTFIKKDLPGGNPIANALVIIAGALIIGVSLVLGFFAFVALSALILVSAAVIGLRVWWLKRKLSRQSQSGGGAANRKPGGKIEVIEGEFHIISDDRDEA